MKQIFFLVAFLMTITSSKYSIGQGTSEKTYGYSPSTGIKAVSQEKKNSKAKFPKINSNRSNSFVLSHNIQSEVKATMVNIQAVRDFTRRFADIQAPTWYKTEAGFIASFQSSGIFRKIAYDVQGRWLYDLLEYVEANMDFETRDLVKRKYYDYDIQIIHQYEFKDDKTVYLIRMQDRRSNLVTLKVYNGEMQFIAPHE